MYQLLQTFIVYIQTKEMMSLCLKSPPQLFRSICQGNILDMREHQVSDKGLKMSETYRYPHDLFLGDLPICVFVDVLNVLDVLTHWNEDSPRACKLVN